MVRFLTCRLCSNDGGFSRHGLKAAGDGVRRGSIVTNTDTVVRYGNGPTYEFESDDWLWSVSGVQKQQETSRHLNRLDVLKELFNVFINRAVGLRLMFGCCVRLILRVRLLRALLIPRCL